MIVLGFYKYAEVPDPQQLADMLKENCPHELYRGTILVSHEGLNGSVSANRENTDKLRQLLRDIPNFDDLFFKEEVLNEHPFKKMKIKVKNEIVRFDYDVDLKNTGKHLTPDEFLQLYDADGNLKEDVILLDTRNDYEFEVGRFKGATHLNLQTFREFTKKIDIEKLKNKKVVMYCTGGVRCEKATAYVKEQGIEDVAQLHQGIIRFGHEKEQSVWEGKCFVFDKRMVSPINSDGEPISKCHLCGTSSDLLRNCRNEVCNLFYVSCEACEEKFNKCCSEECMKIVDRPKDEVA